MKRLGKEMMALFFAIMVGLTDDAKNWPRWVRRTYLLMWPVAAPLRIALILLVLLVCGMILGIVNACIYIRELWQ